MLDVAVNGWLALAGTCALALGACSPSRPRSKRLSVAVDATFLPSNRPRARHRLGLTAAAVRLAWLIARTRIIRPIRHRLRATNGAGAPKIATQNDPAREFEGQAIDAEASIAACNGVARGTASTYAEIVATHGAQKPSNEAMADGSGADPKPVTMEKPRKRAAPVTRLALPLQNTAITWPAAIGTADALDEEGRLVLIGTLLASQTSDADDVLALAFEQEGHAARAFIAGHAAAAGPGLHQAILCKALQNGNAAERAAAMDALVRSGHFEQLRPALDDPLDALAARAALAIAGTRNSDHFAQRIRPLVEPGRFKAILTLLGGILS